MGIENNLHWNLDVIFIEDGQLKRRGNSTENLNVVSKVPSALVDNEKSTAFSKPMKRMEANHDDAFRELIMKLKYYGLETHRLKAVTKVI